MTSQEHLEALYQKLGKLLEDRKEYYTDPKSREQTGRFYGFSCGAVDGPVSILLTQMSSFVSKETESVNWDEVAPS